MESLKGELKVVNIGLRLFYDELKRQGVSTVHVNWRPPAVLEKDLEDILSKIL